MEAQTDGAAGSSPAGTENNATEDAGADLLTEMRAFVGESDKAEPSASKAKEPRKEAAKQAPAEAGDEPAAATDDAGPKEGEDAKAKPDDEGKPVAFKTFKARVDKLSAQRREAEERADKADMQVQRLTKAVEILQKELQRAPTTKADPRDEQLRALEYEKQITQFNNELEQQTVAKSQQRREAAQVEERAQVILNDVVTAAKQHGVDPKHVFQVLQVSSDSPQEIARRLAAAAAPAPTPKPSKPAPKSVARSGQTAGNEYVDADGNPTSQTMADYLRSLDG